MAKGVWETSSKRVFVQRNVELREKVGALLDHYLLVEAVGVESPTHGEIWSNAASALFLMVNEAIWLRRKDAVFFDPLSLKALTKEDASVRKGQMFKSDMVEACRIDASFKGRLNHNEADAYHLARFAARFWMLVKGQLQTEDLLPSEYKAFAKIHTFTRGKRAGQTVEVGAMFKENQRFFQFSKLERP